MIFAILAFVPLPVLSVPLALVLLVISCCPSLSCFVFSWIDRPPRTSPFPASYVVVVRTAYLERLLPFAAVAATAVAAAAFWQPFLPHVAAATSVGTVGCASFLFAAATAAFVLLRLLRFLFCWQLTPVVVHMLPLLRFTLQHLLMLLLCCHS